MASCLVALGANLGNRQETLSQAVGLLGSDPYVEVVSQSRLYETVPVGGPPGQPPFLNGAVFIETSLDPYSLLDTKERIERQLGRERHERWSARTIDIDLLLFDDLVINTKRLTLPHPRLAVRRFVLEPAVEIAPAMVHPRLGWTIAELWEHLLSAPSYLAIAGTMPQLNRKLARDVADRCGARLISDPEFAQPRVITKDAAQLWQTEVELLTQRAALLDPGGWPEDSTWTISDFWFDQADVTAGQRLSEQDWLLYHDMWETLRERIVAPKLVVMLRPSPETLLLLVPDDPTRNELNEALTKAKSYYSLDLDSRLTAADGRAVCPTLDVKSAQLQQGINEVTAAMQSMQ